MCVRALTHVHVVSTLVFEAVSLIVCDLEFTDWASWEELGRKALGWGNCPLRDGWVVRAVQKLPEHSAISHDSTVKMG